MSFSIPPVYSKVKQGQEDPLDGEESESEKSEINWALVQNDNGTSYVKCLWLQGAILCSIYLEYSALILLD